MSYAPTNLDIYTSAYAGTLGAITNRSGRPPTAFQEALAGAFAQAIDIVWDSGIATWLDTQAMQSACGNYWSSHAPPTTGNPLSPARYAQQAADIVALVRSGDAYYAAQGIVPPPIPGGGGGGGETVTKVSFDYTTGYPLTLLALAPGTLLDYAGIEITTAFNAPATLSLGTAANPTLQFGPGDIDLQLARTSINQVLFTILAPTLYQLSVSLAGATEGAGTLLYKLKL